LPLKGKTRVRAPVTVRGTRLDVDEGFFSKRNAAIRRRSFIEGAVSPAPVDDAARDSFSASGADAAWDKKASSASRPKESANPSLTVPA